MPFFEPVKNVPALVSRTCATTLTVTKGVPVRSEAGVLTICATNSLDCEGVAAETHVSGDAASMNIYPCVGSEGPVIFKIANATIAATSAGKSYFLQTVATNNVALETADSTLGAFYCLTANGTHCWGYLAGAGVAGPTA